MAEVRKTALVTGASRGIGAATAKALAAQGYHVIVHYGGARERAEDVAAQIRAADGSAETVGADLAGPDTARALAEEVARRCNGALHALVLNAAVMPGNSNVADCPPEMFDEIFAVNLRAPFFLLQHLAPVLAEGASVVMLSSVTAHRAIGAVAAYATMKAAIESLVRRAAVEYGPRWIRVNAVAPATTATEIVAPWLETAAGREKTLSDQALKRINQPEDVADVIAFLCSDQARIITGAVIPADGGTLL
jgi:NAD(P)-dependent dehydrogenase (short-subunit alcohol dehydrogenase family)